MKTKERGNIMSFKGKLTVCKNYLILISGVVLIILLTGVSSTTPSTKYQREVNVDYKFSMNLLRVLNQEKSQGNSLVSPLGIINNLAVLYMGSTGDTKKQIAEILMTSSKPLDFLDQQQKRMNELVKAGEEDKITFEYANILLADNTYCKFKKSFKKHIDASKFCELETVRYKNIENTVNRINEWCKKKTHDRIKTIISPEDIKSKSSLGVIDEPFFTLLGAIYFKGDWSSRFDENTNNKFPFYYKADAPGEMIYMMEQNHSMLEYAESTNIKVLKLPFEGKGFSLIVVLPRKVMTSNQLLTEITPEEIRNTVSYLSTYSVNVKMPKFTIENRLELEPVMNKLGFVNMRDFYSMFERTDIASTVYLNKMSQKNYFAVGEKGAEATSVTCTQGFSVGCAAGMPEPPPVEFIMDRPFLYFLQHEDNNSGTVLFAGCYAKPPEIAKEF
jgi:serine protease inhibitor